METLTPPLWKWTKLPPRHVGPGSAQPYQRGRTLVLVSFDPALEFRGEPRPQHMISISETDPLFPPGHRRVSDAQVASVLRDFGAFGAEEDNHQPGIIRMFFLLADIRPGEEGLQCECKEDEQVVVEPDGFRWSRTRSFDLARWPAALRGRSDRQLGTAR